MVSINSFFGDGDSASENESHVLGLGDIVKLRQPYKPQEWVLKLDECWSGFTYGIVAEINSTEVRGRSRTSPGRREPQTVNLFLYDNNGHIYIPLSFLKKQYPMLPTYVCCHRSEFDLYHAVEDEGYLVRPIFSLSEEN